MNTPRATHHGAALEATVRHDDEATAEATGQGDSGRRRRQPEATVGPLGGIVFSALCLAAYVGTVAAVALA